jgi:rod shape-determining protein MreD
MIPIILIVSFFLEGIYSCFISSDGIFISLFSLVSLIIVYPYFNKKNSSYYKCCFLTGLFYDLVYTDTIVFNAFIFTLMGFIIVKMNNIISNSYINSAIMSIIVIVLYRCIVYAFLIITDNYTFTFDILLKGIYTSLLANIIYATLSFIITDFCSTKLKIKKSY